MPRPRPTHRKYYVRTAEGSMYLVLARPGENWKPAFDRLISNYRSLCAALGEEPMPITPIERVKL